LPAEKRLSGLAVNAASGLKQALAPTDALMLSFALINTASNSTTRTGVGGEDMRKTDHIRKHSTKFRYGLGADPAGGKRHVTRRRAYGDGGIDARSENSWRLRYWINGKRFTKTVRGTKSEAQKMLRDLLHSGDTGTHVAPDKITVGAWVEQWIASGAPGRRQKKVSRRTIERYSELLRCHVVPTLGMCRLQQLQATDVDALYVNLAKNLNPRTAHHAHTVLSACLGTAVRKGLIMASPMTRVEKVPSPGESDHGEVLDADELRKLLDGFRGSVLYSIVVAAAFTGARRNEILALRWSDLDVANKTLRIERALEETKEGLFFKAPKTKRGVRTIAIDDDLIGLLLVEREKHLRLVTGVPDGVEVDLSLVRLPEGALIFPSPASARFDFTRPRDPHAITRGFASRAHKLGFDKLRFHDLRGSHETALLDHGVPVHVVAARCGHDPAVLLRNYAKRTKKADTSAAAVISALSQSVLRRP
jgi:integrase